MKQLLFSKTKMVFAIVLVAALLISVIGVSTAALKLTTKGNDSVGETQVENKGDTEYYQGEIPSRDMLYKNGNEVNGFDFEEYILSHATDMASKQPFRIPIYSDKELLSACPVALGMNYDYWRSWANTKITAYHILRIRPTEAVRYVDGTEDSSYPSYYLMYQSDTGARLYLFLKMNGQQSVTSGFPIWMRETLSYADFKDVKKGMNVKDVAKIDSAMNDYLEQFSSLSFEEYELRYKAGMPFISMHLLTDGILKIVYDVTADDIVVKNIIYSQDFTMGGLEGVDEHNFGNPPPTPDENGIVSYTAQNLHPSEMWKDTNYRIQPCDYATGNKAG